MILTCPACNTRYRIDDAVLADPAGRELRCANCSHQWRYAPEPERPAEPSPPDPAPGERAVAVPARTEPPAPVVGSPPSPRVETPTPPQTPVRTPVRPAGGSGSRAGIGCLFLIVIVAVAIAAFVTGRNQIVAWWPAAGKLYRTMGLRLDAPGVGLEIGRPAPSRVGDALVVEGDVTNTTGSERAVPRLRVILRDQSGKELVSKIIDPPEARLGPGAVTHFKTQFEHPSDAATGVAVTFTAH